MEKKTPLSNEERLSIARELEARSVEAGLDVVANSKDGYGGMIMTDRKSAKAGVAEALEYRVSKYGEIDIAAVLPTNLKSAEDYLEDIDDYDDTGKTRMNTIDLARKAAKYEGVISSTIEALTEIPTLGGWYLHETNEELYKLLVYWLENVNGFGYEDINDNIDFITSVVGNSGIEQLALQILRGLYVDGDTVLTESWENIQVPVIKGAKRNLPTRFTQHDVTALTINETLAKLGKEVIYAELDTTLVGIIKDNDSSSKDNEAILKNIPEDVKKSIINGESEGKYQLPSLLTSHFSRKTNMYSAWGSSYIEKAFPAIAYKRRLRALDNATIDGLIQRVWIVKIGVDDRDSELHIPEPDRVQLAVSRLSSLSTQNFLVWGGPDIAVEELGSSDNNILSFDSRYKSADEDMSLALGFPRSLIDGSGSAGSANLDFSLFVKTVSQMERYQLMIKRWIEKKMRQIAVENNYKDSFPKFFWSNKIMTSPERAKNIYTKLHEDGTMGVRWMLNRMGEPADIVIEQSIKEKDEGLADKMADPKAPYNTRQEGRPNDTPDGDGESPKNNPTKPESDRDGKDK